MSDSNEVDQECVDRLRQRLLDHDSILPLQATTTTKTQSKSQQLTANHFQSFLDKLEISPKDAVFFQGPPDFWPAFFQLLTELGRHFRHHNYTNENFLQNLTQIFPGCLEFSLKKIPISRYVSHVYRFSNDEHFKANESATIRVFLVVDEIVF